MDNGQLLINRSDAITISGRISGTGSITQNGSGLLQLSGTNTYSGGTIINSGTLLASGSSTSIGTGTVIVNGGLFIVSANASAPASSVVLSGGKYERNIFATASGNLVNVMSNFAGGKPNTTAIISLGLGPTVSNLTLDTTFSTSSTASNDDMRRSDVLSFQGTGTNVFVMTLSLSAVSSDCYIGWLDPETNAWVNAVNGNTGNNATLAQQGYAGSFDTFQLHYGPILSWYIGAWGISQSGGVSTLWAVLDHNSDFAVVPEPSTFALLGGGALLLGLRSRFISARGRHRRRARCR